MKHDVVQRSGPADGTIHTAAFTGPWSRYSDRPTGWRTRMAGLGGTAGVCLLILFAMFFTWRLTQSNVAVPKPLAVTLQPIAAPPEPVQEVPEGPQQVEQKQQMPKETDRPDPPDPLIPRLSFYTPPAPPPAEPAQAADPVPKTTAPKSVPAPPASRVASDAEATWEALLLAHLEKHRRYPAAARARRDQGVAHVRFTMNRQGKVLAVAILKPSGSAALDRAALDTIRRAQPLPAIPDDRSDPLELTVPVEFFLRR